jgi:hypothetical protein
VITHRQPYLFNIGNSRFGATAQGSITWKKAKTLIKRTIQSIPLLILEKAQFQFR